MRNSVKFWVVLFFLFYSCGQKNEKGAENENVQEKVATTNYPAFNSDSAFYFVQQQVDMGPRVPNSPAHKMAGDYLINTLKRLGASVEVQEFEKESFDGKRLYLRNIIGQYNVNSTKRILLAAHWDTRPFADKDVTNKDQPIDGANDGGSGVGALLEMARIFNKQSPNIGIDIIFFDGEDYGEPNYYEGNRSKDEVYWCLGSQYWSKNRLPKGYSAYFGILLDMVGAENARFYREGLSMNYAPKVVEKVWGAASKTGNGEYFIPQNVGMITDDHAFINENAKIPTIDIIEYGPESQLKYFAKYHHTHNDNMSIISKKTLQAVGETILYVVYNE